VTASYNVRVRPLTTIGLALLLLAGCFESRQTVHVLPGGSGWIEIEARLSPAAVADLRHDPLLAHAPPADLFRRLAANYYGPAVEWPRVQAAEGPAGGLSVTATGTFKDLNALRRAPDRSFVRLAPAARGTVLEVATGLSSVPDGSASDDEERREELAALRDYARGFDLALAIEVPGTVTAVEGGAAAGRTVTARLDEKALLSAIDGALASPTASAAPAFRLRVLFAPAASSRPGEGAVEAPGAGERPPPEPASTAPLAVRAPDGTLVATIARGRMADRSGELVAAREGAVLLDAANAVIGQRDGDVILKRGAPAAEAKGDELWIGGRLAWRIDEREGVVRDASGAIALRLEGYTPAARDDIFFYLVLFGGK
jgi:hypothetical protein